MCPKDLLLLACCLGLLGGLRLTSTTTTTTFVAAMSIANQDIERYLRSANASQTLATMTMTEDRIAMDVYTYAFLNYSSINSQPPIDVGYSEEKARYGEGKILTVNGKLVHISDMDDIKDDTACLPNILGTRGEKLPDSGVPWIALVRRGKCTFEEKVKNVHARGAAGVIIYNDKPVMNLEKMQIKGKSRNITAVITYQNIGLDMARYVDQGIDMMAYITEGKSGMRPINSLNRTSVLFVSISFIVLMIISLVWLIFYYIQRFRYLQSKDQHSRHLCTVTKKAIMKIPTKTGKSTDEKDAESDCCAICIESYKPADCIRVLPCKHEFHKNCIDPWLIEHRTCPMCKLDVLKFYGYVVNDQIQLSPNPQHIPPNDASLDDSEVPVVVVALAPLPSSHHAPISTLTEQQHPQQSQQQDQHQNFINNSGSNSSHSDISGSSINSNNTRSNINTNGNTNGGDNANNSNYNVDGKCHQNSKANDNTHRCCCNQNNVVGVAALQTNASSINNSNSNNKNNNNASFTTGVGATVSSRRNSAPLVLEVSTASRKVTDV